MLTEKTIDQILGVLDLTAKNYESGLPVSKAYQKSVKDIAHRYSIRYQTIADGCRRRLGLDNVNQFIDLLKEWLGGKPNRLKDLLTKNAGDFEQYRIKNFFDKTELSPPNLTSERKVEDMLEVVSLKIPQNIAAQLRALAEAKGESVQDLINNIIKEYVDSNYVEYLKNFINSLPQSHKEQVLAELEKSLNLKKVV
jgi:hypothetical protein